jgi:hypothetical protein
MKECFYDGKTFKYFGRIDGLLDNQIRSIAEDENGTIWLQLQAELIVMMGKVYYLCNSKQ